ncbi:unnamed protein product [Musa acuminata var. zebrina]
MNKFFYNQSSFVKDTKSFRNKKITKKSLTVLYKTLLTVLLVQKLGSVGRSIDMTRFSNYHELRSVVACMLGLEGQPDDPRGSEWKLVYVDYESNVLLVGDDPWE